LAKSLFCESTGHGVSNLGLRLFLKELYNKKINLGNEINDRIRGKKLRIKSAITVDIAGKA